MNAPPGREWLALVSLWRASPQSHVWFAADPKRTHLALVDPRNRDLALAYRWGFVEPPFVGGARPGGIDWYRLRPPGWMLDEGWSLTPETAGIAAHDGRGPASAPVIAWIRARDSESTLVLGGRSVGAGGPADVLVAANGSTLANFTTQRGTFVREIPIPSGTFSSTSPYVALSVAARVPGGSLDLEQFDLQDPGIPMLAYDDGWHEPEYNTSTGSSWRWMSERSILWLRPIGRDVTLRISGESTRNYFKQAPRVRILAGERDVGALNTDADFDRAFTIPAGALAASGGRLTFVSSAFFVPGGRGGDQRHLSVRIFSVVAE